MGGSFAKRATAVACLAWFLGNTVATVGLVLLRDGRWASLDGWELAGLAFAAAAVSAVGIAFAAALDNCLIAAGKHARKPDAGIALSDECSSILREDPLEGAFWMFIFGGLALVGAFLVHSFFLKDLVLAEGGGLAELAGNGLCVLGMAGYEAAAVWAWTTWRSAALGSSPLGSVQKADGLRKAGMR